MSLRTLPSTAPPTDPQRVAAIEIRGLRKSYGAVQAVRGLDLSVAAGEIVAVLGPNGAGKSTTTEMILGLVAPDSGSVTVFGLHPVQAVRQGRVGALLQAGALLSQASVRDLLRLVWGLHAHPLPLSEVVERADVGSFLATKSDKLSGGQAQRVRYALAIMADPDLLVLDEPTVGMDVEVRRAFWASMRDFTGRGRTVLFATHYLEEADAFADRVVVLAEGRVVADGTAAAIKSRVAGRTVSVAADPTLEPLVAGWPGVIGTRTVGARTLIHATDSDLLLRRLLVECPQVRDLEVSSARLEDAFLALTHLETR